MTDAGIAGNDAKTDKAHARAQLFGQHAELDFLLLRDLHVLTYDRHDVASAAVPARPLAVIVELYRLGYGMPYISIAAVYESLALATTVRNDCR